MATLVQNHGASSVGIPPSFGGGLIRPSGVVVCASDPITVAAAFDASNVSLAGSGNVAFIATDGARCRC